MNPTIDTVYNLLSTINDPELRRSLADAGLVKQDWITINEDEHTISIPWRPTTPGCPLIAHISAAIKLIVEREFSDYSAKVRIKEGTPSAKEWNKRLRKKNYLEKVGEKLKGSRMWDAIVQGSTEVGKK